MFSNIKEIVVDLIKFIPFLFIVLIIVVFVTFIIHRVTVNFGYMVSFGVMSLSVFIYFLFIYVKSKSTRVVRNKVILIAALIIFSVVVSVLVNSNVIVYLFAKNEIKKFNTKKQLIIRTKKTIFKTEKERYAYNYGDIKTKIKILKGSGFTKEDVYEKLENNIEFKKIIKNNSKKFENIYSSYQVK